MNCPYCTAPTDYRFVTACSYCESELSAPGDPDNDDCTVESRESRLTIIGKYAMNVLFVLLCAGFGSFIAGVVLGITGGVALTEFVRTGDPSHDCAASSAVTGLSFLAGAYLGCIGGTIVGYKNSFGVRVGWLHDSGEARN